ncbi:MAG: O-antigen ligase family protein [Trueperaceae bacterium]|nr:O-antigen ligase family protein [Trueperaceae bacterium]
MKTKNVSGHGLSGVVAVLLLVALGWQLADTWYLRDDARLVQVGLATGVAVLGLVFARWLEPALPVTLWVAFSLLSIVWSLSPAASVRAGTWHLIYLCVCVVGLAWPRLTLGALVALHLAVLARGIDLYIVTGRPDFNGVWFQQNVQGGQLLLIVPLLAYGAFGGSRYAPYAAFGLGVVLFTGALTYSTASQALLLVGVVAVFLLCRRMLLAAGRLRGVSVGLLLILGLLCGWLLTQPERGEVLSVNFGDSAEASVRVSDPTGTFLARWRIIEDVGRRALAELPLGTGTGTLRHLYSSLQTHSEIETVDAHNYYLQTLLTLGIIGVVLLVWFIGLGIWRAYRMRHWGLAVSLFLFAGYLAFDVMAYYPGVMLFFFGALGVTQGLWVARQSPKDEVADDAGMATGYTDACVALAYSPINRRRRGSVATEALDSARAYRSLSATLGGVATTL